MPSKRPPVPPPVEIRQFTPDDIERGIAKLERRIPEVEGINAEQAAQPGASEDERVADDVKETIRDVFGTNSPEFRAHEHLRIWDGPMSMGMYRSEVVQGIEAGKLKAVAILRGLIKRLEEKRQDQGASLVDRTRAAFHSLDLHPRVADVATELYNDGHYSEAVFNASKALVNLVKERAGKYDLDGAGLMFTVFSKNASLLAVNGLKDQTDLDEQEGIMHLFAGTVLAIRNPGGHDFPDESPDRALELIVFMSYLAKRVDQASRRPKGSSTSAA